MSRSIVVQGGLPGIGSDRLVVARRTVQLAEPTSDNPHLSKATQEHFTPEEEAEKVRLVIGEIDLDPGSCAMSNKHLIRAARFFDVDINGLDQEWSGRVFVNPPGDIDSSGRSNSVLWWYKLEREWLAGRVSEAVFLGFNLEVISRAAAQTPSGQHPPLHYPCCIPSYRIKFLQFTEGRFVRGTQPTHANVFTYLPPRDPLGRREGIRRFSEVFGQTGSLTQALTTEDT